MKLSPKLFSCIKRKEDFLFSLNFTAIVILNSYKERITFSLLMTKTKNNNNNNEAGSLV
jgi:hypothetical protein